MTAAFSPANRHGWLTMKGRHGGRGQLLMRVPPEKFDLASRGPLPRGQPLVVHTHGGLT